MSTGVHSKARMAEEREASHRLAKSGARAKDEGRKPEPIPLGNASAANGKAV
jgi:hypothetical protein